MALFPLQRIDEIIPIYPNIQSLLELYTINYPGTYQILRLLGTENATHLLNLIDKFIEDYGDCNYFRMLFKEKDYFGFNRSLQEIQLLDVLATRFKTVIIGDNESNAAIKPDFIVKKNDEELYFELYTPTDFYPYQFFCEYFHTELYYHPVEYGFNVKLEYDVSGADVLPDFFYVYRFQEEFEDENVIKKDVESYLNTVIFKDKPLLNETYVMNIGSENSSLKLNITFLEFSDERAVRRICTTYGTRSSDTTLFFEDVETLRASRWYPLFKKKIRRSQCGQAGPNKSRILYINFSKCDLGCPKDICNSRFHTSFQKIVSEINNNGEYYDVIQAVNLPKQIWGTPIAFNNKNAPKIIE